MIKGKKIIASALALAMTATMLVGCGTKKEDGTNNSGNTSNGAKEKVSLKVWGPDGEQDNFKKLGDAFNAQDDKFEVTFDFKPVGENDAATQVTKDPDAAADVFMFGGDQVYTLVSGGYLRDLTPLESQLGLKVQGVFDENALAGCKVDGKLYGIPFTPNLPILYYNKSMLTEDEVKSLDKIMAKNIPGAKNIAFTLKNGFYNSAFFNGAGCTLYGTDGTDSSQCTWNNAEAIATVKYLNAMCATGKVFLNNDMEGITQLKDKKVAAYVMGPWYGKDIKAALGNDYAATVLPSFTLNGKEVNMKTFKSYKQIGVNDRSKNPEAAARFAYFLAGKEAQELRIKENGYAPTLVELQGGTYDDPAITAQVQQATAEHSVMQPTIPTMNEKFWKPAEDLGSKIWNKDPAVANDAAITKTLNTLVSAVTAPKK